MALPKAVLASGGAAVVAAVVAVLFVQSRPDPVAVAAMPETAPEIAPETVATTAPEAALPTADPTAPRFDIVRVDPDGQGVIAGIAEPGAAVQVMLGDGVIAEATADDAGQFVAFVTLPPSDEPGVMTLQAGQGDGMQLSDQSVIVAPVSRPGAVETASAAPDPVAGHSVPVDIAVAEPVAAPDVTATPVPAAPPVVEVADVTEGTSEPPAAEPVVIDVAGATEPVQPEEATPVAGTPDTEPPAIVADTAPPEPAPALPEPGPDLQLAVAPASSPANADAPPASPALSADAGPVVVVAATLSAATPDSAGAAVEAPVIPALAADTPTLSAQTASTAAPEVSVRPVSPPVLIADAEGVRVLQPAIAADAPADIQTAVALDTISYNAAGEVFVGGRAPDGAGTVRIYLDNVAVAVDRVEDGQWEAGLPDVAPGRYTIRVDQIADDGTVLSRVESPFQRESTDALAAVMADQTGAGFGGVAVKTVQPGHTLWAIARERYGDGIMYVSLFEANRDAIADPDLIYPGQVFVLPEPDVSPAP